MLPLDSSQWPNLTHAYGVASDIPGLLKALTPMSRSVRDEEPWFSIWSALAHQGDVYAASYAAVPHVVEILATSPADADDSFFQFPAWVEICRAKGSGPPIPPELRESYFHALQRLPSLVAVAARSSFSAERLACCLAAIAAATGQPGMAEAALELSPEVAASFLQWLGDQ